MISQNTRTASILFTLTICLTVAAAGCHSPTSTEDEEEIERSYTKTIERTYTNEFERGLIDLAESAYPPRDSVIAILDIVYSWRDNNNLIPETKYWHMSGLDGILQPYMITIDAIEYYESVIDIMETDIAFPNIKEARFSYQAKIAFHEDYTFEWSEWSLLEIKEITGRELNPSEYFEQVYVVEMSLGWRHVCVEHCMAGFTIKRVIILDETGRVLKIFKHGPWWPALVS